jgi:hypothetical protein
MCDACKEDSPPSPACGWKRSMRHDGPIVLPHPVAEVIRQALSHALEETTDIALALTSAAREVRNVAPDLGFYESYLLVDRLWVR